MYELQLGPDHGRTVTFTGEMLVMVGTYTDGAKLYRTAADHYVVNRLLHDRSSSIAIFDTAAELGNAGFNGWHCRALAAANGITNSFLDHEPRLDCAAPDFISLPHPAGEDHPRVGFNGHRLATTWSPVVRPLSDRVDLYRTFAEQFLLVSYIRGERPAYIDVFPNVRALVHDLGYRTGPMSLYDQLGIDTTLALC